MLRSDKKKSGMAQETFGWILLSYLFFLFICSFKVSNPDINLDGMVYASIARNMAEGLGSLWRPLYTDTFYKEFYENLGLSMWLQSYAFKLFGDHFLIERLSGIVFISASFVVFVSFVRKLSALDGTQERSFPVAWYIFLYSTLPVIIYSATGNILENAMTFFVILSCWFAIQSFNSKLWYLYCFLSAAALLAAVFSKTVSALFVLSLYPFIWLVFRQKILRYFLAQCVFFGLLCGIIFLFDESRNTIMTHLTTQILPSLTGQRSTGGSRFYLVIRLICEMAVPLALALFVTRNPLRWKFAKKEIFLLLLGLAGFLPLLLSSKQNTRYLLPVLPFLCGALALSSYSLLLSRWRVSLSLLRFKRAGLIVFPLLILVICIVRYRIPDGYDELWSEIGAEYPALQNMGRITVASACFETTWDERAYYQRHFKWSFSPVSTLVLERKSIPCPNLAKSSTVLIENSKMALRKIQVTER